MEELLFCKTKYGWKVSDRNGNYAIGKTKDLARNAYYVQFVYGKDFHIHEIDISNFNGGI